MTKPWKGSHIGGHSDIDFLNAKETVPCNVTTISRRRQVDPAADATALNGH